MALASSHVLCVGDIPASLCTTPLNRERLCTSKRAGPRSQCSPSDSTGSLHSRARIKIKHHQYYSVVPNPPSSPHKKNRTQTTEPQPPPRHATFRMISAYVYTYCPMRLQRGVSSLRASYDLILLCRSVLLRPPRALVRAPRRAMLFRRALPPPCPTRAPSLATFALCPTRVRRPLQRTRLAATATMTPRSYCQIGPSARARASKKDWRLLRLTRTVLHPFYRRAQRLTPTFDRDCPAVRQRSTVCACRRQRFYRKET